MEQTPDAIEALFAFLLAGRRGAAAGAAHRSASPAGSARSTCPSPRSLHEAPTPQPGRAGDPRRRPRRGADLAAVERRNAGDPRRRGGDLRGRLPRRRLRAERGGRSCSDRPPPSSIPVSAGVDGRQLHLALPRRPRPGLGRPGRPAGRRRDRPRRRRHRDRHRRRDQRDQPDRRGRRAGGRRLRDRRA